MVNFNKLSKQIQELRDAKGDGYTPPRQDSDGLDADGIDGFVERFGKARQMIDLLSGLSSQDITFSDDQQTAIVDLARWLDGPFDGHRVYRLGGLAGTGKSTIVKAIRNHLRRIHVKYAVIAYTGKAVSVLKRRGVSEATTLHRLLFQKLGEDENGDPVFGPVSDVDKDVVIVDEASMVSGYLDETLMNHPNVRVLYVGDHGQLPPIGDSHNVLADLDFALETPHRTAADSNIIKFANHVRSTMNMGKLLSTEARERDLGDLKFAHHRLLHHHYDDYVADVFNSQVICGSNSERIQINHKIRSMLGNRGLVAPGDKVICLRNDDTRGLYNGMTLKVVDVTDVDQEICGLTLKDPDLGTTYHVPAVADQFNEKYTISYRDMKYRFGREARRFGLFDHAHAVTCHKAQGSEWDTVFVKEWIHSDWDSRRWRYTAATRAAQRLVYAFGEHA